MLIMHYIVMDKISTFAVFQPFIAYLIAANHKMPNFRRYAIKILRLVNPNPALFCALTRFSISHLFHQMSVINGIRGYIRAKSIHQMKADKLFAQHAEFTK